MTIVTAIVSLLTGKIVRSDTAMTGEISLRGLVLPVGGVKEKVIAAHRLGLRQICCPLKNQKDVEHDVPEEIQADMHFVFTDRVEEILENAFEDPVIMDPMEMASL